MSTVNKVILVGNVGNDPEIRYMPSGSAVGNLSVATSEKWKDKQTGQQQEKTEWHKLIVFGKLADVFGQYVKKGDKIYIEGSLATRKWQDQSGHDRWTTEIKVSALQILRSPNQKDGGSEGGYQKNSNEFDQDIPF